MDTALSPVTDLRSRASLSMNPAWPIWLKTGGDEFVSSLLAFSFACLIDSDMLVRALLTVFAVLLLGEVVLATRDWSAPYILTPQRYKNLSISRHPASLDRRRVWDGIGRLMSRQSQCDKGSSVCPSGEYCHEAGDFCCSADESQGCPTGYNCCPDPEDPLKVTGCAPVEATCCGAGQLCDEGDQCCTGPDGPMGCASASNACCGALFQCSSDEQCCGLNGNESLGCAPKNATCCTLENWCTSGSTCCSNDDGSKYCSPVCCGQDVDCKAGDKCCMDDDGQRYCAQSCNRKTTLSPNPTPTPEPTTSSGLGIGPIVGIAMGSVVTLAAIAVLVIIRCRRHRTHEKHPATAPYGSDYQSVMTQVTPYTTSPSTHTRPDTDYPTSIYSQPQQFPSLISTKDPKAKVVMSAMSDQIQSSSYGASSSVITSPHDAEVPPPLYEEITTTR